ncbi:MAG: type II toxin-antitoxin system prevent-host-death family antitoxin [Acidobacteriaceae bacterium]
MEELISATEANRQFSRLLDGVRRGNTYLVTSHGRPIARIAPLGEGRRTIVEARAALLERLRSQPAVDAGHWTRDELYENASEDQP